MRIVIFASSKFSIPLLEKLHKSEHEICAVYSQPPSISGRGMKLKENEVCLKSRELNLKLLLCPLDPSANLHASNQYIPRLL